MFRKSIFLAIFCLSTLLYGQGMLGVNGPDIVDENGQSFLLRGYGLGGWLVPEGYMLHTPGFGSPTDIRNKIVDILGQQDADEFYRRYQANYVNRADIDQIAAWGFNSVRLPFHYNQLYDRNTQTFKESGFAIIDSLLAWCRPNNIYVILDMHCAPGGQNAGNISDSDGIEARLWTEVANQDLTVLIWTEIARRYKNESLIAGYDLINEPVLPQGYTTQQFRDFYIRLVNAIRTEDTNHIVFIEGNWYATDFTGLTPPFDSKMVYSFHKYWSNTALSSIQTYLNIRNLHNVPLWMGESGENSNPWYAETVRVYEQENIGWCWWAHKKIATTTSPLSAALSDNYRQILDYWGGNGSRPSQSFARTTLFDMVEGLKIENCELREGVIPALLDPDFTRDSRPFRQLNIPGSIPAAFYDIGSNTQAYVDRDYKNEGGNGGPAWNQGYAFRNDGVDVEVAQDNNGADYNIGFVEVGERINYTVNIAEAGNYLMLTRVASLDGNGRFRVFLNNVDISGDISVPRTNGWQNWVSLPTDNLDLPAGQHQLSIFITEAGFNYNQLTFFRNGGTSIDPLEGVVPQKFSLEQNYPNPFNNQTTIRFEVPQRGAVTLRVYNNLGEEVETLVNQDLQPGVYVQKWEAENISSGVYYMILNAADKSQTRVMHLVK